MNKDTWWIIFVLLLVGVAWTLQNRGAFPQIAPPRLEAPAVEEKPRPSTSDVGGLPPAGRAGQTSDVFPQGFKIRVSSEAVQSSLPNEEYVVLENVSFGSNEKILLSGLILKNKNNHSAAIGKDENGANIFLGEGERAIIVTGLSPRGVNFKLNQCSGYFNQNYSFIPSIPSFCPQIADLPQARNLKARCIDYLETLPMCQRIDPGLESGDFECSEFVAKHASYAGCVADHKNDENFDKKEWRIYLGKSEEFWGNKHDDIKLLDQAGNLVAELTY